MSSIESKDGVCPTCGGDATVYPLPDSNEGEGHVYCNEDDCEWIHRFLIGVSEYIKEEEENK